MDVRGLARRAADLLLGGPPAVGMCRCGHLAGYHTRPRPFGCTLGCPCLRYRRARRVDALLLGEQAEVLHRRTQRMDGGRGLPRHVWPVPDAPAPDLPAGYRPVRSTDDERE